MFGNFVSKINSFLWGYLLVVLILCIGVYLTYKIRFLQFKIIKIIKEIFFARTSNSAKGDISAFSALNVALSGTVGVGNIAGVATAIALGGPGAVFWMWISGIVGMATKFAEVYLGVKFRVRQDSGPFIGGPMMYIKNGLPQKFHFLAYIYALFGAAAAFGIGNMAQANSVAFGVAQFGVPRYITGLLLIFAVGLVTLGGLKRIAKVANFCVPFMCGLYVFCGLIVILSNIKGLSQAIMLIFTKAFTPQAAVGGFIGSSVLNTIRYGVARGVFSNEAGLGSASVAHSTAITDSPYRQGLLGMVEVFVDTLVVCTVTALTIITTQSWFSGKSGSELTMTAFSKTFGETLGFSIVVVTMILTAYTTNLSWGFYGETFSAFLFGNKIRVFYRILWLPFVLVGALGKLEVIWNVCDMLNGFMAIPNLVALILLSSMILKTNNRNF